MPRAVPVLLVLALWLVPFTTTASLPPQGDIAAMAERVCAHELATRVPRTSPYEQWCESVMYLGVLAAYELTGDEPFLSAPRDWAERREWRLGPRARHADDLCAAQVYLELWSIDHDASALEATTAAFDEIVTNPRPGIDEWWWCDALFMAPPAMAELSDVTGDARYVDAMDAMWWDVASHLYDSDRHLFYRDMRRRAAAQASAAVPPFWGRGNGWVMAGTVRVLDALPPDHPSRDRYAQLLLEMSEAVADLQGDDGLWRPDLIRSRESLNPDTSCSALICCAIAWGVAEGILPEDRFRPVVESAWAGLASAVDDESSLGWVQQITSEPGAVAREHTSDFGVGAFLLAAREVARLAEP
jgi:unsaturated rhamnogalacturonyl hydrolase